MNVFHFAAFAAYQNDISLHPRVRVQLVKVDASNEVDMLSIVMRINRYYPRLLFIISL